MHRITILVFALALTSAAAEFPVEGVHMCCGDCENAIAAATPAAKITGKRVMISAEDAAGANAALAALAAAGFHGQVAVKGVAFPAQDLATAAVDSLSVSGLHVCCGGCKKALGKAASAGGAASHSLDGETLTVTGPVSPAKLIAALNAAGFAGTVATP